MTVEEFTSLLFDIELNIHIAHLQTNVYEIHIALNPVYQDIVELRDRFIEGYQGLNKTIITGYKITLQEGIVPITYLTSKSEEIEEFRKTIESGFLGQIIDDIQELLNTAIYKLKFLK